MEGILFRLVAVVVVGVGAQWLSWRLGFPSILLLLLCGILAGPVTGILDPDAILGDLLVPVVSLSVALILFEGGLSLRFRELRRVESVVGRISTLGAAITWLLATVLAVYLFDLPWRMGAVLGAIFLVTGPTVVGPLLRAIRPSGSVGHVLKWEGIVTDPIGAILAVLIFESLLLGNQDDTTRVTLAAAARTVFLGGGIGLAAAWVFLQMLRWHLIPDFLHNSFSLMLVFLAFAGGHMVQHEGGLLTVTVMGIALANQSRVKIAHIVEFKEDLRVLLISFLFIVLAARLSPEHLQAVGWRHLVFLAGLILVVRPLTVLFSTLGSGVSWRERAFLASVAPRGIVSAAMASVLALELHHRGYEEAELFVPLAFTVIIGTVVIYGLGAGPIARWLGVADSNQQGVLILGAHAWARQLGLALKEHVPVLMVDSNRHNVSQARMAGLRAQHGNLLGEHFVETLDLAGLGRHLALTSNDEVNALACLHMEEVFGRSEVYQLVEEDPEDGQELGGRRLFAGDASFPQIQRMLRAGAVFKSTKLSDEFDLQKYREHYGADALPMFVLDEGSGTLRVLTIDIQRLPEADRTLISLVLPRDEDSP